MYSRKRNSYDGSMTIQNWKISCYCENSKIWTVAFWSTGPIAKGNLISGAIGKKKEIKHKKVSLIRWAPHGGAGRLLVILPLSKP